MNFDIVDFDMLKVDMLNFDIVFLWLSSQTHLPGECRGATPTVLSNHSLIPRCFVPFRKFCNNCSLY